MRMVENLLMHSSLWPSAFGDFEDIVPMIIMLEQETIWFSNENGRENLQG